MARWCGRQINWRWLSTNPPSATPPPAPFVGLPLTVLEAPDFEATDPASEAGPIPIYPATPYTRQALSLKVPESEAVFPGTYYHQIFAADARQLAAALDTSRREIARRRGSVQDPFPDPIPDPRSRHSLNAPHHA